MSSIAAAITDTIQNPVSHLPFNYFDYPATLPSRGQYFHDSKLYHLKGGFTAEVIHQPSQKLGADETLALMKEELGSVVLAAFNKTTQEAETYAPASVLAKNILDVDWLVVVRKHDQPVACGSCTFVTSYILYLNSAMVMPTYQTTGIGFISNALLWKIAIEENRKKGLGEPDLVCRTHNRNVASVLLHSFSNAYLSTEEHANLYVDMVVKRVVQFLECDYDAQTGVSYNVYPEGLPEGTKTSNQRVLKGFAAVGPKDACYVVGNLDFEYINKMLDHSLTQLTEERLLNLAA